jgi:protein subunit release factor A
MEKGLKKMPKKREKLFSLTGKDFKVEHYTSSGPGGSGKDTSNTGVRITHLASGAVGSCTVHRSQAQNKKEALEKLVASDKFKKWLKVKAAFAMQGIMDMERELKRRVDEAMQEKNLKIETYNPEEETK